MSTDSTFVRYVRPPGGATISPEDLEYHRNLTEEEIHAAALSDPDNPSRTDEQLERMRCVPLAKSARWRTGLGRQAFAETFGFSQEQLDDLETGRIEADPVITNYLKIIRAQPEQLLTMVAEMRAAKAA